MRNAQIVPYVPRSARTQAVTENGQIGAAAGTDMYALDAAAGMILWRFASGGSVTGGASIADGSVCWGSGYCGTECLVEGTPVTNNNKVYAFGLGR